MNITQLKYFNAICIHKTVSGAAESLFVSQPTISNAIKELENEFGTILFKRHYRSMVLTPEGEMLYKMSEDLINQANHIEYIMNDMGKGRKIIRLGVPPMIGSLFLPHIYTKFNDDKEIHLEITEGGKNELLSKLSNDYLDMAFISHNTPIDSLYTSIHITKLETVCCVSKSSPLVKLEEVSPADLLNTPLVLFKNSFFQTEMIKKLFSDSNISPKILFQTEQLSSIISMVSSGAAAGFLFKSLVKDNPDIRAIPVKNHLFADVSLIWKKDGYFFSGMKKFSEYMKNNKDFLK